MGKMDKALSVGQIPERICLFCGNEKKQHYEEWQSYYACSCEDVVFNMEISDRIEELRGKYRKPKFELVSKIYITQK